MTRIDAHIHFNGDSPEALAFLEQHDLKLMNICVAEDSQGKWRWQADAYRRLAQEHPDRYAWCTSFDLPRFDDPNYIDSVLHQLEEDFGEGGAVACKVWKNIGMEVVAPDGSYFLVDDPFLEPIFDYLAGRGKSLLMHIAEPLECWLPLKEGSPHFGYYSQNPEWHMFGRDEMPSHQALIAARDAVAARHPDLRVIGAHLASLEYDVDEIVKRFDAMPNFAVDISARLLDFALQDTDKVRQFCLDYQDRILLGTDLVIMKAFSTMPAEESERRLHYAADTYRQHFRFFEEDGPITVQGREVRGIALPADVREKIYTTNAQRWYPGM